MTGLGHYFTGDPPTCNNCGRKWPRMGEVMDLCDKARRAVPYAYPSQIPDVVTIDPGDRIGHHDGCKTRASGVVWDRGVYADQQARTVITELLMRIDALEDMVRTLSGRTDDGT